MANDPDDFVEVKILDPSISPNIYKSWKILICEDNDPGSNNDDDGCSNYVSVNNFTEDTIPWLVLKDGNIGRYINFKTGFDAVLLDASNNIIDYLSVDGESDALQKLDDDFNCDAINGLPYDTTASAPGASDKFIYRTPDGTGDWGSAPSASEPPTEDDSNDKDPNGNPAPTITINDVIVNKGQTAVFTFTLQGAPKTYDVSVDYETLGGTAVAGTDYIYTSGTVTIPAGSATATVSVNTIASSPSGIVYFYLFLDNQLNATVDNAFPTGTILANATSEWQMDQASWNGTAGEVVDISGNGNNGTALNGLTTDTGYLCNGGNFDGSNDYIEIPHNPSLNGTNTLTYMAWIYPDTWGGGIRQVMAKSVHGGGSGRAQMGIFSESGVLKARAETLGGRKEVSTTLPPVDAWTHVAAVFTGYSLEIYINGSLANVSFFNITTLIQTTDPLNIGKRVGSNQYYFDGKIDEVMVNQAALQPGLISTMYGNYQNGLNWDGTARNCGLLHHIQVEHDGVGLTCQPETITFKACSNADCSSLYTSDVVVNLGAAPDGNYTIVNPVTITNGSTDFELRDVTAGITTLSVSNPSPAADNAYSCINSGPGNPCDIEFFDTGFIYDVPAQVSCLTSASITGRAVRTDLTTQQCVPAFANRNETLQFSTGYTNPATGTQQATLNYAGTDYPLAVTPASTGIPINFDANGEFSFTITYPDAGEIALYSSFTGTAAETGLVMAGSDTFVTRPDHLTVYSDDANSDCASNDASCSAFVAAGSTFNMKIRAVCADETVTPNFRLDNIQLVPNLVAPAGGVNAVLGVTSFNMVAADNGIHTISNQTVSEVGVFTFTSTPPVNGYFGETIPLYTNTNSIGRFTPHHFTVTATEACDPTYTYSAQPFSVSITAENLLNNPALNYRDGFVKNPVITDPDPALPTPLGTFDAGTNVLDLTHFSANTGIGTNNNVVYRFSNKLTAPELVDLRAIDGDSISSSGFSEGQVNIRSGRMVLDNSYGPEQYNLVIPLRTEFYTDAGNGGFITNTDDSCTTYSDTLASLSNYTQNLDAGETTLVVIGAANTISGMHDSASPLELTAPALAGPNNNGTVDITHDVTAQPWLQYDWDNDGNHDNNPDATASFGLYRGDDRIIFQREVLP